MAWCASAVLAVLAALKQASSTALTLTHPQGEDSPSLTLTERMGGRAKGGRLAGWRSSCNNDHMCDMI